MTTSTDNNEKLYVIINIDPEDVNFAGFALERKRRPTCVHDHKKTADEELLRLQTEHPDGNFILFESKAVARPSEARADVYFIEEDPAALFLF